VKEENHFFSVFKFPLKLFFFCHSRNNSRTSNTLKNQYSCLFISGTDLVFQPNA